MNPQLAPTPRAQADQGTPRFGGGSLRSYPRNSPQAAARIVALAMLADGCLRHAEFIALEKMDAWRSLGLDRDAWQSVLLDLWEDLLACTVGPGRPTGEVDGWVLDPLLAGIDDAALRRTVLRLCASVVEADDQVHEAEAALLSRAVEQWSLQRDCLPATTRQPAREAVPA